MSPYKENRMKVSLKLYTNHFSAFQSNRTNRKRRERDSMWQPTTIKCNDLHKRWIKLRYAIKQKRSKQKKKIYKICQMGALKPQISSVKTQKKKQELEDKNR